MYDDNHGSPPPALAAVHAAGRNSCRNLQRPPAPSLVPSNWSLSVTPWLLKPPMGSQDFLLSWRLDLQSFHPVSLMVLHWRVCGLSYQHLAGGESGRESRGSALLLFPWETICCLKCLRLGTDDSFHGDDKLVGFPT